MRQPREKCGVGIVGGVCRGRESNDGDVGARVRIAGPCHRRLVFF